MFQIQPTLLITTDTDNKSLDDSSNTTSQVSDPRLCAEICEIREMKERGEVDLQLINKGRVKTASARRGIAQQYNDQSQKRKITLNRIFQLLGKM